MELRRVRKATAKKRILDEKEPGSRAKKKLKMTEEEENGEVLEEEEEEEDIDKEMKEEMKPKLVEVSESNMMTLQQFTDIVLASEGLSAAEAASRKNGGSGESKPVILESYQRQNKIHHLGVKVEEKNNNRNANEMVANLIQNNNDLIVEVKPTQAAAKPKPVVLSPRQPPGSHLLPHYSKRKAPLSSGVVVSVKPRLSKGPPVPPRPPQNHPPNVPHLVREWLSKIPSSSSDPGRQPLKPTERRSASTEALNLSTKHTPSAVVSKTTQVYLRPIPTPPKLSSRSLINDCCLTISPSPSTAAKPVTLQKQYSDASSNSNSSTVGPPSPPRLEITRVKPAANAGPARLVGRATPFENTVRLEAARARALRDVQLAHTKDMHGNL